MLDLDVLKQRLSEDPHPIICSLKIREVKTGLAGFCGSDLELFVCEAASTHSSVSRSSHTRSRSATSTLQLTRQPSGYVIHSVSWRWLQTLHLGAFFTFSGDLVEKSLHRPHGDSTSHFLHIFYSLTVQLFIFIYLPVTSSSLTVYSVIPMMRFFSGDHSSFSWFRFLLTHRRPMTSAGFSVFCPTLASMNK